MLKNKNKLITMKKTIMAIALMITLASCGGSKEEATTTVDSTATTAVDSSATVADSTAKDTAAKAEVPVAEPVK